MKSLKNKLWHALRGTTGNSCSKYFVTYVWNDILESIYNPVCRMQYPMYYAVIDKIKNEITKE